MSDFIINKNYHTHMYLCKHATGDFEDYIERAIALGYTDLGFSDHAPLNDYLNRFLYSVRMSINDFKNIYIPRLKELQKEYEGKINIHIGGEIEYFKDMEEIYPILSSKLEYLVLGQHYIKYLDEYISVYSQLDIPKIIAYTEQVVRGINKGIFKIIAHPDIFCWGYPFWDDVCEECSIRIIEACKKNNVLIEINANGIRNCEKNLRYTTIPGDSPKEVIHNYAYPKIEFFQLCAKLDALCIVNDDCHNPELLHDDATIKAYEFAKKIGVKLVDKVEL